MTAMDALRALVFLKRIKRKIEAGTATGAEERRYNVEKERAWEDAEQIIDRRALYLRRVKPRNPLGRRKIRERRTK